MPVPRLSSFPKDLPVLNKYLAQLSAQLDSVGGGGTTFIGGAGGGGASELWKAITGSAIAPVAPYSNLILYDYGLGSVGAGIYKNPSLPLDVTVPSGTPGFVMRAYGASGVPGILIGSTDGLSAGKGFELWYDFANGITWLLSYDHTGSGHTAYRKAGIESSILSINATSQGPVGVGIQTANIADDTWLEIAATDDYSVKRANLRFNAATVGLATPVNGSWEFYGGKLYFTVNTTRYQIAPYPLVSPLTTKGDIWGFSTVDTRVPVTGNNGYVLTEDSTVAAGVAFKAASGGSGATIAQPYLTDGTNFFHNTQQVKLPTDTTFAWVNQGTAVLTTGANGDEYISAPSIASAFSLKMRTVAVGSTWTVTGKLIPSFIRGSSAAPAIFLCAYDGTKVVAMDLVITADGATGTFVTGLSVTYWTNTTTLSSSQFTTNIWPSGDYWFRIIDNGTNMLFQISANGDEAGDKNWTQIFTAGHHSFLTGGATDVGWGVRATNSLGPNTDGQLVSFSVV